MLVVDANVETAGVTHEKAVLVGLCGFDLRNAFGTGSRVHQDQAE